MNDTGAPGVLFLSSPTGFGADTAIHLLLLKSLDPSRFALHAAVQKASPGEQTPIHVALRAMPGVKDRPTDFGPSFFLESKLEKILRLRGFVPAALSLAGLARYIRRHRIRILHSTDRPRDAIACVALGMLTGARSVVHVHVKYGDWMSRGVKWALRRADAVVGVSQFVRGSLLAAGCAPERTHGILNAIDLSKWDPSLDGVAVRKGLGVEPQAPFVVSVARLFSWKGHKLLVQALALVKQTLPHVRLAIVGSDYPEGSGTSRELVQLAESLGVADNLIMAGQRNDVPALLAASDVFALPSFEEPFGLVFAEAMAMKRPVVALDNGGTPEVVEHGKSGLLSAPGDVHGLAQNLLTLLADPGLRARMGEYGRRRVERDFTNHRLAEDVSRLYLDILSRGPS
jgi:glycosyltransferase involved in cell wall biosynthesis